MATINGTNFFHFVPPLSNVPFSNHNSWSAESDRSIHTFNTSSIQKNCRPTATNRSEFRGEIEKQTAVRTKDGNLLSTAPHLQISVDASKIVPTSQHVEQPPLTRTGLLIDQTYPRIGESNGGSPDHPTILEPGLVPCEQHILPSIHAQALTLPPSSELQDQTNQKDTDVVAQSLSVESALQFLPRSSDSSDGWTDENMAELEKELGLALEEEQVGSSLASTPSSPSPPSIEAPQIESQNGERIKTIVDRPEESPDNSQHNLTHGLESEREETRGIMQQQDELGHLAIDDQQDLVEVVNADNFGDKEATEVVPAAQPKHHEIDEHRYRLRGIRFRRLGESQIKTTQYRVVRGRYPNKSEVWVNEDDLRMSMLRPPSQVNTQDLALQLEMHVFRVCEMRSARRRAKDFEYLVDASCFDASIWITEDQLRISYCPLIEVQHNALLKHSTTSFHDEQHYESRVCRGLSAPAGRALEAEPATRKQGHQDTYAELNSENYKSVNADHSRNGCDVDDEDARPAKRRKSVLGVKKAQNCRYKRSRCSPSPTIEEDEEDDDDDDDDNDDDKIFTSSTRTTPTSESALPMEIQRCPHVTDADQDWEIKRVIGKENLDGVLYYLVDWQPTLLPEQSLGHAKELVNDFEARLQAQRRLHNDIQSKPKSKATQKASLEVKTSLGQQEKKPRGRPRKQT